MNLVQERKLNLRSENETENTLDESSDFECSICLDDLDNGEENRILQCGHVFHKACVAEWLKNYYTCPYCRQCEGNITCHWLWLKPYGLAWLNKFRNYNYNLKPGYIELTRKKKVLRINLYFIKRVFTINNIIKFIFNNDKTITLWFKDAYAPFMALQRSLDEMVERRRLEIRRDRIQRQIHRIERMEGAWNEPPQLERHNQNIEDDDPALDLD